jgi:hypothetical protein
MTNDTVDNLYALIRAEFAAAAEAVIRTNPEQYLEMGVQRFSKDTPVAKVERDMDQVFNTVLGGQGAEGFSHLVLLAQAIRKSEAGEMGPTQALAINSATSVSTTVVEAKTKQTRRRKTKEPVVVKPTSDAVEPVLGTSEQHDLLESAQEVLESNQAFLAQVESDLSAKAEASAPDLVAVDAGVFGLL